MPLRAVGLPPGTQGLGLSLRRTTEKLRHGGRLCPYGEPILKPCGPCIVPTASPSAQSHSPPPAPGWPLQGDGRSLLTPWEVSTVAALDCSIQITGAE